MRPRWRLGRLVVLDTSDDGGRTGPGGEVDFADGTESSAERRAADLLVAAGSEVHVWRQADRRDVDQVLDGRDMAAGGRTPGPEGREPRVVHHARGADVRPGSAPKPHGRSHSIRGPGRRQPADRRRRGIALHTSADDRVTGCRTTL